jgi:hypothetical protein
MWRRVDPVKLTDVSEERIASIFRVEKSAREETAWTGSSRNIDSFHRITRRHIPEDGIFHSQRCKNLKSHILYSADTGLNDLFISNSV